MTLRCLPAGMQTNARGNVTHMASFFRVQNGLITEWMYDTRLDAPPPSGGPAGSGRNSAACQAVSVALRAPSR